MIKRMNKATSLLIAAAAMISIIPASAADVKKVDTQDGTVYNAVAYKDGKFFIDGAVDNKDDAANYLANGKYNTLANVDSGATTATYGSKYIDVQDGDYFVDLTNGSVISEDIKSNSLDDAASALRKNVKKDTDGRYVEGTSANQSEQIKDLDGTQLKGNKFADAWYGVQYANDKAANGIAQGAGTLNVYTDGTGSYIDADYNLGSIKVTTTVAGASGSTVSKIVNIENTNDKYDSANATDAVTATVSTTTDAVIGQDSNFIYRKATITVKVTGTAQISKINGIAVGGTAFDNTIAGQTSFQVIQKISKAQASDDIDGAKYAKTVTNYVMSNDTGATAATLLNSYSVSNGKIVNYTVGTGTVDAQTIVLSTKNGYSYTDISDKSNDDATVVDTDVDGNIYRLDSGYIYQWNNDSDWEKVYKVDGSLDEMSVYDKNNIVAWNENDEVYSVIGTKATETPVDTTTHSSCK